MEERRDNPEADRKDQGQAGNRGHKKEHNRQDIGQSSKGRNKNKKASEDRRRRGWKNKVGIEMKEGGREDQERERSALGNRREQYRQQRLNICGNQGQEEQKVNQKASQEKARRRRGDTGTWKRSGDTEKTKGKRGPTDEVAKGTGHGYKNNSRGSAAPHRIKGLHTLPSSCEKPGQEEGSWDRNEEIKWDNSEPPTAREGHAPGGDRAGNAATYQSQPHALRIEGGESPHMEQATARRQ